jgi:Flp pilus assembly pilin Flp
VNSIKSALVSFVHDEDGASASEYAVLVALVVVAVAAAVSMFNLSNIYQVVSNKVIACVGATNGSC